MSSNLSTQCSYHRFVTCWPHCIPRPGNITLCSTRKSLQNGISISRSPSCSFIPPWDVEKTRAHRRGATNRGQTRPSSRPAPRPPPTSRDKPQRRPATGPPRLGHISAPKTEPGQGGPGVISSESGSPNGSGTIDSDSGRGTSGFGRNSPPPSSTNVTCAMGARPMACSPAMSGASTM
ncbi:hypothetical protein BC826DRAFT_1051964 [Russula brevipes]|nr:hypothetical protein BC826DRAFT_1051964 [Russula brevipes]